MLPSEYVDSSLKLGTTVNGALYAQPGQPQPSALSSAAAAASPAIQWDQLPNPSSPAGITGRVLSAAKNALPAGKYSLGGAAVFAALFFTATPVVVLGTVTSLALASLGCHHVQKKIQKADEDAEILRKQQRQDIQNELGDDTCGYTYFRETKNYSNEVVTDGEFNEIFVLDISRMSYSAFLNKHGGKVFNVLDERNRQALGHSFLNFAARELTLAQLQAHHLPVFSLLPVSKEQVQALIAGREIPLLVNGTHSYEQFIERNGTQILRWSAQSPQHGAVRAKLEAFLLDKDIGFLDIQRLYAGHLECMPVDPGLFISRDLDKLQKGALDYPTFKARNGLQAIVVKIDTDTKTRAVLVSAFSKLPYEQLTSLHYSEDRALLGLGPNEVKAILTERWSAMSFESIIQEDKGFFKSIGKEFKKEDWREKALAETQDMTVKAAGFKYPDLFRSGILNGECVSNNLTISQRLAEELTEIQSFESLHEAFPQVLFECGILNADIPRVSQLVTAYIRSNFHGIFLNDAPTPDQLCIDRFNLIPKPLAQPYQESKSQISLLRGICQHKALQIQSDYQSKVDGVKKGMDGLVNLCAKDYAEKKQQAESFKTLYESATSQYQAKLTRRGQISVAYEANRNEVQEILKTLLALEREKAELLKALNAYPAASEEHQRTKGDLQSTRRKIDEDSGIAALRHEATSLEKREKNLIRQKELQDEINILEGELKTLQENVQQLEQKISGNDFVKRKAELEASIAQRQKTLQTPVTGVAAALGAIANGYVGLSQEESSLAEMKKEESLLLEKKEHLQRGTASMAKKKAALSESGQDFEKALKECRASLQQNQQRIIDREANLKKQFSVAELESQVKSLEATCQALEIKKKRIQTIKSEIDNSQSRMDNLNDANARFGVETGIIDGSLYWEEINKSDSYQCFAAANSELAALEENHKLLIAQAQQRDVIALQSYEADKNAQLVQLDAEFQQGLKGILSVLQQHLTV